VKVLLDENLDHRLRNYLDAYEVFTVTYKGSAGLKNGELLRTAEADGIDIFLTGDQTLVHEQNLAGRRLAIVALSTIEFPILKNNLPPILAALDKAQPGSFQAVECGTFSRKHRLIQHSSGRRNRCAHDHSFTGIAYRVAEL
jgi:predicted nuclease of predicted toxin-antitoxin system